MNVFLVFEVLDGRFLPLGIFRDKNNAESFRHEMAQRNGISEIRVVAVEMMD